MTTRIADLAFTPNPIECPKCPATGCNLDCMWDREPNLWEGDQA